MNWAPQADLPKPVVKAGEFAFAATYFNHGHIYGQTNGLREAGGHCKWAWDPDAARLDEFCARHPEARRARRFEEILEDSEIRLITAAAIPCLRAEIGHRCLRAGKHYFTDKSPFTTLEQLAITRQVVSETGYKYLCDYSERLHTEAGWHAGELARSGAIGRVLQVLILAPHNLAKETRPDWFFHKSQYGGILTDIGSHQFDQFLHFAGAKDGVVNFDRVENYAHPDYPGLEDFGEASLTLDNGVSCYCRTDWFNPRGHRAWGDGRTFILGTDGYIEVRKYLPLESNPKADAPRGRRFQSLRPALHEAREHVPTRTRSRSGTSRACAAYLETRYKAGFSEGGGRRMPQIRHPFAQPYRPVLPGCRDFTGGPSVSPSHQVPST